MASEENYIELVVWQNKAGTIKLQTPFHAGSQLWLTNIWPYVIEEHDFSEALVKWRIDFQPDIPPPSALNGAQSR